MIRIICLIAIHIESIGTFRISRRVFHMQVNLLRPEVILGFREIQSKCTQWTRKVFPSGTSMVL